MDCFLTNEPDFGGLKERIAQGDQQAFKVLFTTYSRKLNQFAFSLVRSTDAAREIVDEVFIRIWRNKETIHNIRNLRVYLYTATKNTALNYLSARARQNVHEPFDFFEVQLSDGAPSPEKRMISSEIMRLIREAVESLPPRCKMVFKLVREDGLSYREVGEVLHISPKTVDAQMVIAVRQISEKLRPQFDYFPRPAQKK